MKTVILFGNPEKQLVADAMEEIRPWLEERAEVRVDTAVDTAWEGDRVDFVVMLGGDGTMLSAARKFSPSDIPIVGINMGKFGFLTETTVEQCQETLIDVLEESYEIRDRMMLQCQLQREGNMVEDTTGLNDVVVSRTSLSRLLTIDFFVDGETVNTYRADGLIVATPVGSTAHSLSAGGPIVVPDVEAFIVSPICPHTLSNRPIVLPPTTELEVRPGDYAERPSMTVDGHIFSPLEEGDVVRVRRAEKKLRLIQTGRQHYFRTLRNKLGWSGQPNYVR